MAQKDVLAASKTMLRAIEATTLGYSNDGCLKLKTEDLWPAVAKSARALAAIYREAGHPIKDVAELLRKDLRFLAEEGKDAAPGDLRSPFYECVWNLRSSCAADVRSQSTSLVTEQQVYKSRMH